MSKLMNRYFEADFSSHLQPASRLPASTAAVILVYFVYTSRNHVSTRQASTNSFLQSRRQRNDVRGTKQWQSITPIPTPTPTKEHKKERADTWIQDVTRSLIGLGREMDCLFDTSKSNKHLWEQISSKMRDKGFDRSPTMCTGKWRNLLKEFKKVKHQDRGGGSGKIAYYKELEDLLRERIKHGPCKTAASTTSGSKVDSYVQFSDRGPEDANMPFGPVEGSSRSTLNLERRLDHEGHPLAIAATDGVTASEVPPWNWRETTGNGGDGNSYNGRVITVKWGDFTRRIGIDGTTEAIKEAIKSAFGLRTRRAFWLEDEEGIIRCLDRDMPLGIYSLHLDEGITIKVCVYDEAERIPVRTEENTLYTEDDFRDFLSRRGWSGLRELSGFRSVDTLDELRPGAMYQGGRMVGD